MGKVVAAELDRVLIAPGSAQELSPLKPGDGVVFDAADWRSPGEPEEGGRVYEVTRRGRRLEVAFANDAIRFDRIRVGPPVDDRQPEGRVPQPAHPPATCPHRAAGDAARAAFPVPSLAAAMLGNRRKSRAFA